MNQAAKNFARIVIPSPLKQPLMYEVPLDLRDQVSVGMRVLIPLGKRKVVGIVFEMMSETDLTETRPILALLDQQPILDSALIQLSRWMAQYYLATIGEVLGTILPPTLRGESQRTVVARPGSFLVSHPLDQKILALLRQKHGKISVKFLNREISGGNVYQSLERLESQGAIEIRERLPGLRRRLKEVRLDRDPAVPQAQGRFIPNPEQDRALQQIDSRLQKGGFETFLLHGVTGSGKTEVYLRAIERVRQSGRRSLILTPEISLTPQLMDRLNDRFPGRIGVLHSGLTAAERWAHWWHIGRGNVDVVVGARSAVFAPLRDLGLIVVDEEHDSSYKQEEGVRYNGRDVAVVRGKLSGCPVVLGSATPAIESYDNCRQGRYRLLEITNRVNERPLPRIEIVDLRSELKRPCAGSINKNSKPQKSVPLKKKNPTHGLISQQLAEALRENYEKSRQSLIFLNRRGFSNFLQCTLCGYVLRCEYCSVTLTLHLKQKTICCHHCNFRRAITEICPGCGNATLSGVGAGTEQIEQSLHQLVPDAHIARMDRDTTSQRGSHETLIRQWEKGQIDILVGTQMITKGHDVTGVTLVGALLADLSLNLPDFRAAERTFQLLSQVAGRSGRGDDPGKVIVQTYTPDHYAIQHLINHDYKGFLQAEMEFRRAVSYPPFSRLVSLRVDGPKSDEVESKAKTLAEKMRERESRKTDFRGQIEILGPAPAPIYKLRNRYRWQLLLKGKQISPLLELANYARNLLPRSRNSRLQIDVDPYNML
jgi:primosomal protein N' (replication factor Y)